MEWELTAEMFRKRCHLWRKRAGQQLLGVVLGDLVLGYSNMGT